MGRRLVHATHIVITMLSGKERPQETVMPPATTTQSSYKRAVNCCNIFVYSHRIASSYKGGTMSKRRDKRKKKPAKVVKYGALAQYDEDNNLIDKPVTYSTKARKSHAQAWTLARAMMEVHAQTFDRSLFNLHVHCKSCSMSYCQGGDGVDVFCKSCFYKDCCQKDLTGFRNCQHCGGGHAKAS